MSAWSILDYAELTGKNKIVEWLDGLPAVDQAKIDNRLLKMVGSAVWPDKWVSRYRSPGKLHEFRISGMNVQYRPLGAYCGPRRYIILAGAIEKGDKIPKSDVDTALEREKRVHKNERHAVPHQF
ncbi:type II toxin-antitoxin system RelE/ParE family toxin [Methylocystis rosea]|uniref:type II toxin-antitoxin system RelE/ParE family toxin n=1 Tax=Methylocystis rosea TaxID=173366 RepID=UPI000A0781F0